MYSSVKLVLFTALVASAFGAIDPNVNVTSGLEDYTLLVGRHMQNDLDIGELQIATVKARHSDRMESIASQQQLVLQEVQQFDNNLVQQQAFSLGRKYCVQKYKSLVPTYNDANKNFTKCLTLAESQAAYLTSNAENALKYARDIREDVVPSIYPDCNRTYSDLTLLENCVTKNVETQVALFNNWMDEMQTRLQSSLYQSSVIATEANHCSFLVEKKVLTSNGGMSDLADACVEDLKQTDTSALALESGNRIGESKFLQKLTMGRKLLK